MLTQTRISWQVDRTAMATYGPLPHVDAPRGEGARITKVSRSTFRASAIGTGLDMDPEEAVLVRLRSAESAKRRADAHARIAAKRKANAMSIILGMLERPEYQITISDEALREILDSYPEGD